MQFSKRMERLETSVFSTLDEEKQRYLKQGKEVYDFTIGSPNIAPSKEIIQALIDAAKQPQSYMYALHDIDELRQTVKKWYQTRYEVELDADTEILSLQGSQEGLAHIALAICDEGDIVLIPSPSYPVFANGPKIAGAEIYEMPMREEHEYLIQFDEIPKDIARKAKMMIISYPNNPTGAIMTREDLEPIAEIIKEKDLYVISDEIYAELTYGQDHCSIASLPGMRDRTIIINGFSKSFAMTGWRMGFATGPELIMQQILKIHQFAIMAAPTTSQYAAIEAMTNGEEDVQIMRNAYNQRRRFVLELFSEMGLKCFEPEGAFYLFPCIKEFGMSSDEFANRFLHEEEVAVIPGTAFGDCGEGFLRISYAYSIEELKEALGRLANFVERLRKEKNL